MVISNFPKENTKRCANADTKQINSARELHQRHSFWNNRIWPIGGTFVFHGPKLAAPCFKKAYLAHPIDSVNFHIAIRMG